MCAIAGLMNFEGIPVPFRRVEELMEKMTHRGRDSAACLHASSEPPLSLYPGIALGHRRLSIIDLSERATQPMRSIFTSNVLVYNGEIYNYMELRDELVQQGYQFRTQSDSEVVLAAYDVWGESCVKRLNGMFAFAVWDERHQSLFCARDPIGIKPFYYAFHKNEFLFASESQALARSLTSHLNKQAVACYLLTMYVPGELSIFENVKKLLPGHAMRVHRDGQSCISKFWKIPEENNSSASFEESAEALLNTLDAAMRRQVRSDVPIGILLSGGFDSGMILASAAKAEAHLHSYSVGYRNDLQDSELNIAAEMAKRYGTTHHQKIIEDAEVIPALNQALESLSEPVADSAILPTHVLSQMASADGVKVLLSGTGGDEVFAGYTRYVSSSPARKILHHLPTSLRKNFAKYFLGSTKIGARLRYPSLDMVMHTGGSARLASYLFDDEKEFLVFLENVAESIFPPARPGPNCLYNMMDFDLQVYLPDLLLMILDQITMAHTLEGRVPLLDLNLLNKARKLPENFHAEPRSQITRRLMRRMSKDRISVKSAKEKKRGFSGPFQKWIKSKPEVFSQSISQLTRLSIFQKLVKKINLKITTDKTSCLTPHEIFILYCLSRWNCKHGLF